MWRAFFLAVGISMIILGAECLVIDKAILHRRQAPPVAQIAGESSAEKPSGAPHEIEPPEWAGWSLMSAGAVVMLYSFTIPKRVGG